MASSEIYIKSRRTRQRFLPILAQNLRVALGSADLSAAVHRFGHQEFEISTPNPAAAAEIATTVFGIERINLVDTVPAATLAELVPAVAEIASSRVAGKTFAVRVKRAGSHSWRSREAEVAIGDALIGNSAGVDLSKPEAMIRVRVENDEGAVVSRSWRGPGGLPIGTQAPALVLLSGGIDSPVAAWMMLRRGCPIDLLHFKLECNQADHALAVGHDVARRWGHGAAMTFHVVDFTAVKKELEAAVHPRLRQVLLKQLMAEAGHRIAAELGTALLVTGDSLGQVSSQTAANIAEIDRLVGAPTLRPLLALTKQEIIDRARQIGTFELSTRAREVCDLSGGRPVETAAAASRLRHGMRRLRPGLIDDALTTWESVAATDWMPGFPLVPTNGTADKTLD
jgi:thiamine biosynthesis protein ThiI